MLDNKKQWYLLILVTVWLIVSLTATIIIIIIVHSLISCTIATLTAAPTGILHHLYRYHFPIERRTTVNK